ncbi:MAG: ABC transporter permease [Coriobacteriia bacterium]|nr:ABC transporter permease [Coriobacteriia bacterium]MCL2871175.1 ABC transporter permease [Coriobacteriia bacterium]
MDSFLSYGIDQHERLLTALWQHVTLVAITLALSIVIAALITALVYRNPKVREYVQGSLSAFYAVPSLALFALSIPLLGIGETTAIVVLVAYNQFMLVRNFIAGLAEIDNGLVEAARSLGLNRLQTFIHVQLPLAAPVFIAGIRLAVISTISIATIASLIDAGGLGDLLFLGLRTNNLDMLLWATLLAAAFALVSGAALTGIERLFARNRQEQNL